MLSDDNSSVERSPLSKKKDRQVGSRKSNISNSNRDEMVRIEQSNASREIMTDALWNDGKSSTSFDQESNSKYDRTEKRGRGSSSSKGYGRPTQRSNRYNDREGDEEGEDDNAVEDDVNNKSTSYSDRRRKSSGLSTTLQRLKKIRQAKKDA